LASFFFLLFFTFFRLRRIDGAGWGRPEGQDIRKRSQGDDQNPDTMKRSRSSNSLASTTSAATTMCHSSSSSSIDSGNGTCSGEGQGSSGGGDSGGDSGSDHDPSDEVTVARGTSAAAAMGARLRAAANLGVCSIARKSEARDLCVDRNPATFRAMRVNGVATPAEDNSEAVARAKASIATSPGIYTDSESDYDDDEDDDEYSDEEDDIGATRQHDLRP